MKLGDKLAEMENILAGTEIEEREARKEDVLTLSHKSLMIMDDRSFTPRMSPPS